MFLLEPIIEASTLKELQTNLSLVAGHFWGAVTCHYLVYHEHEQLLFKGAEAVELEPTHQPGQSALNLTECRDQSLLWPASLMTKGQYRISVPVFVWGSLAGVLCLEFKQEPEELEGLDQLTRTLGHLSAKIVEREMSGVFLSRCKELLVRAVEAQGKKGHVERCCRLVASLAKLLDCSAQVKIDLQEAVQYHDIGLLTFEDPKSTEAQQRHPRIGASLLKSNLEYIEVARLVEFHHERYDGSGHPDGKSGQELPLECWILALAEDFLEFWESSLSSFEGKLKEFFDERAKHHHPDVVDALCGLVDAGELETLF